MINYYEAKRERDKRNIIENLGQISWRMRMKYAIQLEVMPLAFSQQ